jgi:hypothetical protein
VTDRHDGHTRRQRLTGSFKLTERQLLYLAAFLAVGSGFLTMYAGTTTWGTPIDDLKAILWGSVVSEGVKWVGGTLSTPAVT